MAIPFLNNITIDDAGYIQFKTSAGGFGGKINQNGNDLVLSNTSGDIIIGNGSDDVYIGDGASAVDIRFEQNMAIYADSSSTRTLTLGGANTNLILDNPSIVGDFTLASKLKFTGASGYILFDYEPSGDTGEYTTEVPLLKVQFDTGNTESAILSRVSEYRAVVLGVDDTVWLRAGDTGSVIKENVGLTAEVVLMSAEQGFHSYAFPNNDTTWSNRNEFRFYGGSATASDNGLYIGDGGNTQFIDLSRNLKNIGNITLTGDISTPGQINLPGDGTTTSFETLIYAHGSRAKLMKQGNAAFWQPAHGSNQFEITDCANDNSAKGNVLLRASGHDDHDNKLILVPDGGTVEASGDITSTGKIQGTELEGTSLDINGDADISGTLKVNSNYTANTDANDLQIGSTTTGNGGLSIITGNSQTGGIYFGDNDNNDAGRIKYIHSSNRLLFDTNRTNALILDSSQNATFAGTVTATYFYGDGSNITGVTASNADTVDNLHAASFLRSDTADTATGKITLEGNSAAWDTTTPGTTTGSLHFDPGAGTDHFGNAITFGASDSDNGTTAQAGIYLRTDGGYGSRMYFATTDSYASGSKVAMYINHDKDVYFKEDINVAGNIVVTGTVDGVDISGLPTFSTVGTNFAQLGDVSVASYIRVNADETLSYLNASQFLTAIGGVDGSAYLPLAGGTMTGALEIGLSTSSSGTTGTTFLELDNNVGSDLSQQQTFIDFKFTDTNANYTPQVRIGAQVGPDADANSIEKEGAGSFVVYTAPIGTDSSGNSSGLAESMRVSYNGDVIIAGDVTANGTTLTGDQDLSSLAPKASPTFTGDITIPNKIIHTGDTNTYMQFEAADVWRVVTGGTERLHINTNRILVGDDMNMNFDGISGGNVDGNNVQQSGNSGTVVYGGFLNPASEANMVHIPHIINDLAGFNRWSNATITTSGFYKSRSGSSGSYTYSNEVQANDSGWANAFDAHSSTAGSWYSDNGSDGIYQHGTDTPGVVELEWTNEATYSLWAGIVFGSGSFTATYVKIEAYRAGAWQTLCEITDNTDQVVLRQVSGNSGTNAATRRLRYTLGGSVNNSYFRIHSLYMVNYAAGNLNLNNTGTDTTRGINFLERYKDGYLHGHLRPGKDDTYDLGSSSYEWKDGYFDGTVYSDALNVSGNITVGGTVDGIDIATLASNNTGTNTGDQDLSGLAPIASPTFTGTPAAPTASAGTNTTQIATTAFVSTAVANLVDSAPEDLNTLNELAAALADDAAFSTTVTTALGNRVRVDTASQGLDATQQSNARTNIDAQVSGDYITGTGSLSAQDLTDIGNLSGTNTGDQDLSGLVTLTTGQNITGVKTFQTDETFFKADDGHHIRLQRNDTSIVANNELGRISFAGDDPTDGTYNIGAQIIAKAENSWSASDYETRLEFQTRDTGGAATTALTLKKNQEAEFATHVTAQGKLTIGNILNATGDPDKFLCVNGSGEVQFRTGAEVLSDIGATSGGVTGSGTANRVTFWSGSSAVTSDAELTYNATTNVLSSQSFQITNNRNYLGTDTSGNARTLITLNDDNEVQISHSALSANSDTVIYSGNKHIFKKGGATKFSLDATGNAVFNHNLSVSGNTTLSGNMSMGQGSNMDLEGVSEITIGAGTEIQIDGNPGTAGQSMLSTGSAVEWGYPKQQTIIVSNFDDASSTSDWINMPINYPFESTTATYYHFFNCPAAGTVKKITMMHVHGTMTIGYQGTTTQLRVVKNGSGQTASGNLLADDSANDGSKISYSPNTTFAAGDRLQFQFKRSNSTLYWKGVAASIVIEFNAV